MEMKKKNLKILRIFAWIGFAIYLVAMVYFLFFCEAMGRVPRQTYQYNFEPFTEIRRCLNHMDRFSMVINLVGNVVCFIPLGFVLPVLSSKRWGFFKVTLLSICASGLVEVIQLVTKLGSCDVDDIILNTCGGMIGCILFYLGRGIYRLSLKTTTHSNG